MFVVRSTERELCTVCILSQGTAFTGARIGAVVFPGERGTPLSGWSKAKSVLDTASGVSGWWLHDLRRNLATGLQRLGVRLEVTEAVLNHLSGSRAGVVGIYQRHDWAEEKRGALQAWCVHLLAAAEGRPVASKLLPFSRAG